MTDEEERALEALGAQIADAVLRHRLPPAELAALFLTVGFGCAIEAGMDAETVKPLVRESIKTAMESYCLAKMQRGEA